MMIDLMLYLAKVSGGFSILYLVYVVCFRKLTFHKLNRAYLMAILLFSLILPVLTIGFGTGIPISKGLPALFSEFSSINENWSQTVLPNQPVMNVGNIVIIIYSIVLMILFMRLTMSVFELIKIKRQSTIQKLEKFYIIHTKRTSIFSFFNWIFIPHTIDSETSERIIEHEKLHGNSFHTLDLIVVELFISFFWFNPFVYFFRRDLKSVHEFQIDHLILKGNLKKSAYLQLLLSNIERSNIRASFCNHFNGSTIRRRLDMMTKRKSSGWKTVSYLLLIPLAVLIIMAFSDNQATNKNIPDIFPVKAGETFQISSGFGNRIHPITNEKKIHFGIDLSAPKGTPIVATANGIVSRIVFLKESYGKLIEIDHRNGYVTRYAQLNDFAVREGERANRGDVIGYVGQSGLATGPHLHYEVFKDGVNVNPRDYLSK